MKTLSNLSNSINLDLVKNELQKTEVVKVIIEVIMFIISVQRLCFIPKSKSNISLNKKKCFQTNDTHEHFYYRIRFIVFLF